MKRHSPKKIAAKAEKRRKWQIAEEMVRVATKKALLQLRLDNIQNI